MLRRRCVPAIYVKVGVRASCNNDRRAANPGHTVLDGILCAVGNDVVDALGAYVAQRNGARADVGLRKRGGWGQPRRAVSVNNSVLIEPVERFSQTHGSHV